MARVGFLLLLLLGSSHALAQSCYCTSPWTSAPTGQQYCSVNSDCWACAPGAYDPNWQQLFCTGYVAPVSCSTSLVQEERGCQVNYSGSTRWQKEITSCTDGRITESAWQQVQDNCTKNPPTCQVSAQTQINACEPGYTGSVMLTRVSSCPDPYGDPVWGDWATMSNSCVKALTNPTNPTSPVSPISPLNTPQPAPAPQPEPVTPAAVEMAMPAAAESTTSSAAGSSSSSSESSGQGLKLKGGLGLVLNLEIFLKPGLRQPSVFADLPMQQELPSDYGFTQNFFIDLISRGDLGRALDDIAGDRWRSLYGHNPIQQGSFGD